MNVLGVSCYYHDASATLVRDGKVLAAVEEERFTRKKHDSRFPVASIGYVLKAGGLTAADVDAVAFYEKPLRKFERLLASARTWGQAGDDAFRKQIQLALRERLWFDQVLRERCGIAAKVVYCEHHASHAASAFYISPFLDAAILTVDGVGEWDTTARFLGSGTRIEKIDSIRYPHSLGLLYSAVTSFLGFKVNNDEYKVMGLASYGRPVLKQALADLIDVADDGSFRLDLGYFGFQRDERRMYSAAFIDRFGQPRVPESEVTQAHMDLAASLQEVTEEVLVRIGRGLHAKCGGVPNVCLAGGVALNGVANWRFLQDTPFERIYIQPAAGDGGGSMGAALAAYYEISGAPRSSGRHSTLLGPAYDDAEIEAYLTDAGALFVKLSDDELIARAAELIHQNFILGWFQGRAEFGPRALGSRSILANACRAEMKDTLNRRVKFREDFRPFAPAVPFADAQTYFELDDESPFMLLVVPVRPGMGEKIPAVTHVDGSARVQTVHPDDDPRFHKLLTACGDLSGVPVVINTSFNVRGEPIVCSPDDAYRCFMRTDIDYLFMGNFLVEKGF